MESSLAVDRPGRRDPLELRRDHILSAAERCFVRGGFHRSTMQDVAAEAHMSAGNVYRYFESKDAIVAGLVARERSDVARDFETLASEDMLASFAALMRRQVLDSGRDKAALWLEICTEAARNPTVQAVVLTYEAEICDRLAGFFDMVLAARPARRRLADRGLAQRLAGTVLAFVSGIMVSQAMQLKPNEAERQIGELLAIVEAAVDGALTLEDPRSNRTTDVA